MRRTLLVLTTLILLLTPSVVTAQPGTVEVPAYPAEIADLVKAQVARYHADLNPYRGDAGMSGVVSLAERASEAADAGRVVPALTFLSLAAGTFEAERALQASANMSEANRRAYLLATLESRLHSSAQDLDAARSHLARAEENVTTLKGFETALYAAQWVALGAQRVNDAKLQIEQLYRETTVGPETLRLTLRNAAAGKTFSPFARELLTVAATHDRNDPNAVNLTAVTKWVGTAQSLADTAGTTGVPFQIQQLRAINVSTERYYALALLFMNIGEVKTSDYYLRLKPLKDSSETAATRTLEDEVRSAYSSFDLMGISARWGYQGVNAVHAYDTAGAILEETNRTFDSLTKAGGALHQGSELLRTLLAAASPKAEADLAKAKKDAETQQNGETTPWYVPSMGLVVAVGVGVAAVGGIALVRMRR